MFKDDKGVIKLSKMLSFSVTNNDIKAGVLNPEVDARNTLIIYDKSTKLFSEIRKDAKIAQ